MDKREADNIAWAIIRQMPRDDRHPELNDVLNALSAIVKDNQKVWDAMLRYDNGYDVLCGLCGEDYVSIVRGVPGVWGGSPT